MTGRVHESCDRKSHGPSDYFDPRKAHAWNEVKGLIPYQPPSTGSPSKPRSLRGRVFCLPMLKLLTGAPRAIRAYAHLTPPNCLTTTAAGRRGRTRRANELDIRQKKLRPLSMMVLHCSSVIYATGRILTPAQFRNEKTTMRLSHH